MSTKNWIEIKPNKNGGRKIIFPDKKETLWFKTKESAISKGKEIAVKLWIPLIDSWKDWKYRDRINPQKKKIWFFNIKK